MPTAEARLKTLAEYGPTEVSRNDAYVEFIDVSKTYDGVSLAVANLNICVRKGEFLTLLGPSGSGKTTALMMLAGFEAPTSGEIRLKGRSLSKSPPHKRNMGVVFQNYALFPHMTVAENIAFPLVVRGRRGEAGERVARALGLVRLSGLDERRPAQLSGGQQQRVALARALVFDPDLVLMDEPLGALDKRLREQLQFEIKQIQKELGVSVIYVTHDQSEALTMSDRIAVFDQGAVQQLASPEDLYERPMTAFVAEFLGENNRLDGTVAALDGARLTVRTELGQTLRALRVSNVEVGQPVSLSVRPEKIATNPAPGAFENLIEARVEDLIYMGDHTRLKLRLPGGLAFHARSGRKAGQSPPARGENVSIGWKADDCRAFASAAPRAALGIRVVADKEPRT